jgi:hypothetical protein
LSHSGLGAGAVRTGEICTSSITPYCNGNTSGSAQIASRMALATLSVKSTGGAL